MSWMSMRRVGVAEDAAYEWGEILGNIVTSWLAAAAKKKVCHNTGDCTTRRRKNGEKWQSKRSPSVDTV